ncbi:MAG: YcaO-like family protein [Blastocatellia bacterium]|nr:YcaO-like family protein [Blastocatellia bacterium]
MKKLDLWTESRFTGLFTSFGEIAPRAYDPEVFMWGATLSSSGFNNKSLNVGGAAWTKEAARMACIGEAIERFQASPLPQDQFIKASINSWSLDEMLVKPDEWVLFHDEQYSQKDFPFTKFDNNTICNWVCFRSFASGLPYWIPEELAYLFPRSELSCTTDNHQSLCASISTGLSAGRLGHPVLLRGVQEVIERDAIIGAWWESYPLEEYPANFVFSLLDQEIKRRVIRPNLTYKFYRIDSPYSSNVTIVSVEGLDLEGYCFSAGAACRETIKESWLKSILEAIQGRGFVRYLKDEIIQGKAKPIIPTDFSEHAVYYSIYPEKLSSTVLQRAKKINNLPIFDQENLNILSEKLGVKHPILFRNMTPTNIDQTANWQVLKVAVPGLQPLHGNHNWPHLGGKLWKSRSLEDWSKILPHPFA